MKLSSLEDLFVNELQDLYSAETQIIKALPKMAKTASSSWLVVRPEFSSNRYLP